MKSVRVVARNTPWTVPSLIREGLRFSHTNNTDDGSSAGGTAQASPSSSSFPNAKSALEQNTERLSRVGDFLYGADYYAVVTNYSAQVTGGAARDVKLEYQIKLREVNAFQRTAGPVLLRVSGWYAVLVGLYIYCKTPDETALGTAESVAGGGSDSHGTSARNTRHDLYTSTPAQEAFARHVGITSMAALTALYALQWSVFATVLFVDWGYTIGWQRYGKRLYDGYWVGVAHHHPVAISHALPHTQQRTAVTATAVIPPPSADESAAAAGAVPIPSANTAAAASQWIAPADVNAAASRSQLVHGVNKTMHEEVLNAAVGMWVVTYFAAATTLTVIRAHMMRRGALNAAARVPPAA